MPLIGKLSTMSLVDLLQWLDRAKQSGTLRIEHDRVVKTIAFDGGDVVGCSSDDPRELLGHFLLARGRITETQLGEALRRQALDRGHLGQHLIELGALTSAELKAVLVEQSEETIYSVFDWEDAVFRFEEGEPRADRTLEIRLAVDDVLLRGLKRWDEASMIREVFPHGGFVLARTDRPLPPEIAGNRTASHICELVDGRRTIGEVIVDSHGTEYQVKKFLYEMHKHAFLRIVEERRDLAAHLEARDLAEDLLAGTKILGREHSGTTEGVLGRLEDDIAEARRLLGDGRDEEALARLEALYAAHPHNDPLRRLTAEAEAAYVERAYRHWLPAGRRPHLARPLDEMCLEDVTPGEFFLLSRIDGHSDVRSIVQITPQRELDTLRALKKMRESGWIRFEDGETA